MAPFWNHFEGLGASLGALGPRSNKDPRGQLASLHFRRFWRPKGVKRPLKWMCVSKISSLSDKKDAAID